MKATNTGLTAQGVLILAVLGGHSASAFTALPTCQSAKFATKQSQMIRELRPATHGLCSQLPVNTRPSQNGLALFRRHQADSHSQRSNNNPLLRLKNLVQFRAWLTALSRVQNKIRRATMILAASAAIYFGSVGTYTPPASASSTAVVEKLMPASNEQIIDNYVKKHIFDDDDATQKDPLEAAYREAYEDYKTTGAHPQALKEITSEVLGQGAGNKLMKTEDETSLGVFGLVKGAMRLLERRGMSEATALGCCCRLTGNCGTLLGVAIWNDCWRNL